MKKITIFSLILFALYGVSFLLPLANPKLVNPDNVFAPMCLAHPFGTDHLGRDIFSLFITGYQRTILVMICAIAISFPSGILLGTFAGYFGGLFQFLVQIFSDIAMVVPSFILALILTAIFGPVPQIIGFAIGFCEIGLYANHAQAICRKIKEEEYIKSSQLMCMPARSIMVKHIFPKVIRPSLTFMGAKAGIIVLSYASLTFIGLGSDVSTPDWGTMLYQYRIYFMDHTILLLWPSLGILFLALTFYLTFDNFSLQKK